MIMVSAVKWVDEVIPDAPYAITEDFMKKLFDEYNIDYIIHGDDPCILPDGSDAYALAKKAGRYKQIKRTEGVSSTDIVGLYPMPDKEFTLLRNLNIFIYIIFIMHLSTYIIVGHEDPSFKRLDRCGKNQLFGNTSV